MTIQRKKGGGKLDVWRDGEFVFIRETTERGKQVDTVVLSVPEVAKVVASVQQMTAEIMAAGGTVE